MNKKKATLGVLCITAVAALVIAKKKLGK